MFILSCGSSLDGDLLLGSWKVSDWEIRETGQKISRQMDFTFKADKRYEVDYGSQKEVGGYYLMGQSLITMEDGQTEKSVWVQKLTKDSLVFEMNRAGSIEEVVLERAQGPSN